MTRAVPAVRLTWGLVAATWGVVVATGFWKVTDLFITTQAHRFAVVFEMALILVATELLLLHRASLVAAGAAIVGATLLSLGHQLDSVGALSVGMHYALAPMVGVVWLWIGLRRGPGRR